MLSNQWWLAVQGIIQNYSGAIALLGMLMMWHHSCDRHWWCWRGGKFNVHGTSWRVCSNHHTNKDHVHMQHRHDVKHPERVV